MSKPDPGKNLLMYLRAKFRRLILLLDGNKCRNPNCLCNKNSSFIERIVSAHHIIFKSHGIDDSPENGIILCNLCHYAVHNGHGKGKDRLTGRQFMLKILDSLVDDPGYRWEEVHKTLKDRYGNEDV